MVPGLQLRQVRERLGLTYRDVERASFELASRRGRPEFIIRISRLADIENHDVVPGLHKLYSLAAIYHLNPLEICRWYEVPIEESFHDGACHHAPQTHLAAPPVSLRVPLRFDPSFDPQRTEFLSRMVERWGRFEGALTNNEVHYFYGFIGLADHRMEPLLRPGSIVLIDGAVRQIERGTWRSEFERPLYFVDVRTGYRCGWFDVVGDRLILHPHPLSRCAPEYWHYPKEVDVIGRVTGIVTRLYESDGYLAAECPEESGDSNRRAS
jgi:transcriptional regulator with XRE-family HTH domain